MKSGNLNFLETSGPLHACNGTALTLLVIRTNTNVMDAFVITEKCAPLGYYAASSGNNPKDSSSHLLRIGSLKLSHPTAYRTQIRCSRITTILQICVKAVDTRQDMRQTRGCASRCVRAVDVRQGMCQSGGYASIYVRAVDIRQDVSQRWICVNICAIAVDMRQDMCHSGRYASRYASELWICVKMCQNGGYASIYVSERWICVKMCQSGGYASRYSLRTN